MGRFVSTITINQASYSLESPPSRLSSPRRVGYCTTPAPESSSLLLLIIISHLWNVTSSSAKLIFEGLKGKRTAKLNLVSISSVTWFFASSMARSWIKINSIGCSAKFYEFTWRRPWIFLTKAGLTLSSNSSKKREWGTWSHIKMHVIQPAGV